MIITEYNAKALNVVTNESIDLGLWISREDAWRYISDGLDWDGVENPEEWYFQVIESDNEEDILSF